MTRTELPRTVLLGSGSPLSIAVLRVLSESTRVVGVVVPPRPEGAVARMLRWRRLRPFRRSCRALGAPLTGALNSYRLVDHLQSLSPDMLWVASFPVVISDEILRTASAGALNVHFSLLPRHRGPNPLFWTYFDDDREAGVSIHWMTEVADAGPIAAQGRLLLERGARGSDLYRELVSRAGILANETVRDFIEGEIPRAHQNERLATVDPRPRVGNWEIDFEEWTSERVWHFLRGVSDSRRGILIKGVPITAAASFERRDHQRPVGSIDWHRSGSRIYCRDGVVVTEPLSLSGIIRAWLLKLRSSGSSSRE